MEDLESFRELTLGISFVQFGELTLGMLSFVQIPSDSRRSLISQANIEGHSRLYSAILLTTGPVATRGLLPPIARGLIDPVS